MKLTSFLTTLGLIAASSPLALAAPSVPAGGNGPNKYTINGEIKYKGPVTPGGENVTLSGTAQSIRAQIEELNPSFNPDDFEIIRAEKERIAAKGSEGKGLDKRSKTEVKNCGKFGWAPLEGYLLGDPLDLPGTCEVGANTCARLTCGGSIGTGVADLCNDNPFSIEPVCTYLRTYIPDIGHTDGCSQSSGWFGELNFVGGQLFDSDNYNIIVGSVVDSDEC